MLGTAFGTLMMVYYVIRTPLTQKLYFEMVKSSLIGLITGLSYFRYENYLFNEKTHAIYLLTLERTDGIRKL